MGSLGQGIKNGLIATAVGGVAVFGVVELVGAIEAHYKHWNVTFTVSDKERVCDSSSNGSQTCRYLIYTDKGVFEDTDSITNGKFNSSDVYGELNRGSKYDAVVYGNRVGWLSWYPNIVKVTPVK